MMVVLALEACISSQKRIMNMMSMSILYCINIDREVMIISGAASGKD